MWRGLLGIGTAGMLLATTAVAKADSSANYFLPACRNFISPNAIEGFVPQGRCAGILEGLSVWAEYAPIENARFCLPNGVTLTQLTTVVVRWLDQRPERWNQSFGLLASYALPDAWPCPPKR
jgi:hypothetical protein